MAQTRSRGTSRRQPVNATIEGLQGFLKDMGVIPSQMARAEKVFQTIAAATVYTTAKQLAIQEGPYQTIP
jgi:predicted deacylase